MSGYKQSVIDSDAASLWSFDGDSFDPVNRTLIVPQGEPQIIIDEIDNLNPAIFHIDNPTYPGYRMGMPSLVTHEQTDQNCMVFGYYGRFTNYPTQWPKAFLEVPHTSTYMFPRNGSFTIEFLMRKDSENTGFLSCGVSRPIIRKAGVFDLSLNIPCYNSSSFSFTHPGGFASINFDNYLGKSLWGRVLHITLTWFVESKGGGEYRGTARMYINARIASEQIYTYLDTFPNTNIANPFEIAGLLNSNNMNNDRNTSSLFLDQIAVYDKALLADEIADHYSKAFPYEKMIEMDFASNLWTFSDVDSLSDFSIRPTVGSLVGEYIGTRAQIVRQMPGPPEIVSAKATSFSQGGMAAFHTYTYYGSYTPLQSFNSNYTLEIWFNVTTAQRCILLACQSLRLPFNGICVQLNVRDNNPLVGSLQFTEGDDAPILNSLFVDERGNRLLYNDGHWHHLALVRSSSLQLWLDGKMHSSFICPPRPISQPGQLILMNSVPGQMHCSGLLSQLAIYGYDLQPHQIRARVTYAIIYRIRGMVTLMGIPYRATLRFYRSSNGELLKETQSDPITGQYSVSFYDNSNVDILVFDGNDYSVRYRAYGPVTPSEFTDLPIII